MDYLLVIKSLAANVLKWFLGVIIKLFTKKTNDTSTIKNGSGHSINIGKLNGSKNNVNITVNTPSQKSFDRKNGQRVVKKKIISLVKQYNEFCVAIIEKPHIYMHVEYLPGIYPESNKTVSVPSGRRPPNMIHNKFTELKNKIYELQVEIDNKNQSRKLEVLIKKVESNQKEICSWLGVYLGDHPARSDILLKQYVPAQVTKFEQELRKILQEFNNVLKV